MSTPLSILYDKVSALQVQLDKVKQPRSGGAVSSYKALADDLANIALDVERIRRLTTMFMADELGLPSE